MLVYSLGNSFLKRKSDSEILKTRGLKKRHVLKPGLDCGLWTVDYGLWTVDCGLWTIDCGLCPSFE